MSFHARKPANWEPDFAAMDILYLLIPVSVAIALVIGAVFWWAMSSGQFDELDREAGAVVEDDESRP